MAELTISWETLNRVSPEQAKEEKVVTGEGEAPKPADAPATPAAPTTSDKPFWIYINAADGTTASSFDTVEKVILDDDRIKLGSHAFHAVKMSDADAKADPLLKEKGGKELPRMVFVSADFKTVKPLEGGSLKLGEVWNTMKATANRFYVQDLDAVVRSLKDVLVEFDKINAERKVLEEKERRVKDKPADMKDVEAKRAELDAREKKANDKKDNLWKLRSKDAKAA
jgi:hypothetical protein